MKMVQLPERLAPPPRHPEDARSHPAASLTMPTHQQGRAPPPISKADKVP